MNADYVRKDVVVIGGGPGGVAAAKEAGKLGASVGLVEQDRPGGRALWHSLVPSKVWLDAANAKGAAAHAQVLSYPMGNFLVNPQKILDRLETVKTREKKLNSTDFEQHGVQVFSGRGRFLDNYTVQVKRNDEEVTRIHGENIIIATGSVPLFPPDLKPDGDRILAPRFLSHRDSIPESIIVIGGGVTGSETIYLFNKLGSDVTAVTDIDDLLPRSDTDISEALEHIFRQRGVEFKKRTAAESVVNRGDHVEVTLADGDSITAEYAFVAIGRKPDLGTLNLKTTGVTFTEKSGVKVGSSMRTSVEHILAIGDVTGPPMLANRATIQGRIAAYNAVLQQNQTYFPDLTVEAIYTEPEVAQVGLTEKAAAKADLDFRVLRSEYGRNLKANIVDQLEGFLKLIVDEHAGKIHGAGAIGYHASDILSSVAVALRAGMSIEEFRQIAPANPTLSELLVDLE